MKLSAIIIFAFVLCAQCQWDSSAWTNAEGTLSICVDGSAVSVVYQESTFGICQGTVSGDTITGNFYEGGGLSCNTGTFSWTISEDGNSFLGNYECDDDGSYNFWPPSLRIGSNANTDSCGRLGGSIAGVWGEENIVYNICVDGDEYETSYSYEDGGTVTGYETGDMVISNQVGSGTYSESNGDSGSSLLFSLDNGNIGSIFDSNGEFFYEIHAGVSGSASSDACGANDPDGDDFDFSTIIDDFSTIIDDFSTIIDDFSTIIDPSTIIDDFSTVIDVSTFFSTIDVSTFFSTFDFSTFSTFTSFDTSFTSLTSFTSIDTSITSITSNIDDDDDDSSSASSTSVVSILVFVITIAFAY